MGITAEGDMIAAMGLRMVRKRRRTSVNVHKTLALSAYGSSVQMAQERGPFKIYDAGREENNPFVLRIKESRPETI